VKFLKTNADVVVTKGLLAHIYGGLAASRAGVPCVWHVQEVANGESMGGLYVSLLNRLALRWPRFVVVDAPAVGAQFVQELHARERVKMLYNGVDLKRFSADGPIAKLSFKASGSDSPIVIGHIGRIVPLKGQHVLLEAFASLCESRSSIHLVLAGTPMFDTDHYLRRLKRMVTEYHLEGRVHFLGFRDDVSDLLRSIDIFVHPSVEADSPVSILEAMATGKPIIATRVPGTSDLVADGVEGHLVPPSDASALAEQIGFLLDSPTQCKRLAAAARTAAEQRFDQRLFVASFEKLLTDAVTT